MKKWILVATMLLSFVVVAESPKQGHTIYRPTFELKSEVAKAGIAFLIEENNKVYVVSAQHLIGFAGGLTKDYRGEEMKANFKAVKLEPIQLGFSSLVSKEVISIPGAKAMEGDNFTTDVFIAPITGKVDSTPFSLSKYRPSVGDKVFLFAPVGLEKEMYHPAVVVSSEEYELGYLFDNKSINLRATSGAPVLNLNHQVVGINLAGGEVPEMGVIGWSNPGMTVRKYIKK